MNETPTVVWVGRFDTFEGLRRHLEKIQPMDVQYADVLQVEEWADRAMDVVIVESVNGHEQTCETLERISAQHPDSILLLHSVQKPAPERLIQYMSYGIRSVLTADDDPEVFMRRALMLLDRRFHAHAEESGGRQARTICFFGSKGGVGKTFLSISTACLLGQDPEAATILIDLNLQFGDIDLYLNANSMQTLGEAVQEARNNNDRFTDFILDNHIHKRTPNLHLLSAPLSPEKAAGITGNDIASLLKILKRRYDWIVVDAGGVLSETTIAAFEKSDRIFLVVSDEIASAKNAGQIVQLLKKMNYGDDRMDFIVNRSTSRYQMDDDLFVKMLGRKPCARVPESARVADSIHEGYVLAEENSSDPAIREIQAMMTKVAAEWSVPFRQRKAGRGFFSRLLPGGKK